MVTVQNLQAPWLWWNIGLLTCKEGLFFLNLQGCFKALEAATSSVIRFSDFKPGKCGTAEQKKAKVSKISQFLKQLYSLF